MKASISIRRVRHPARPELRVAVGNPAQDGDILGQELLVVEHQRGNVALRIDLGEVAAVFGPFGFEVDPDPVEHESRLLQRDVVGEAARPGVR